MTETARVNITNTNRNYFNLFTDETTNTNGDQVTIGKSEEHSQSEMQSWTLAMFGTWGGATMKLQASPDDGTTWIDITDATATANTVINVEFRMPFVRAVITGGTAATLSGWLI